MFAQSEGILPAPESAHAIRAAIDEAIEAREQGRQRNILFCLSGHGHFDLASYDAYLSGKLQDFEHPGAAIAEAMETLPK
jgi:predicted alternative tryptophan synthase beta-subunit